MKLFHVKALRIILATLLALAMVSCQRLASEEPEQPAGGKSMVHFNISQFETLPFSTAQSRSQPVSDLCKQIDLAVFQGGTRKEKVTQKRGDDNFGTLSVALAPGTYKVVIVAHNQDKTPTMTNADKITFSGDLADTFSWSKDITVNEGNGLDVDVSMRRVVAMVRFITTDNVPDDVSTLQFYYTGGSSTLDGLTGNGCVNSRQTVKIAITDDMKGKTAKFEIYTFPKSDSKELKIEVTGLGPTGEAIYSHTFENVPVSRNQITQFTGALFSDNPVTGDTSSKFMLTTDDEWLTVDKSF